MTFAAAERAETDDEFWFRLLGDRDPGRSDVFAQAFTDLPADYFDPPDPVDDDARERDAQAREDHEIDRADARRKGDLDA